MRGAELLRTLWTLVALAALAAAALVALRSADALSGAALPGAWRLGGASVLFGAQLLLSMLAWRGVARAFLDLPAPTLGAVFWRTLVVKYLPGAVWQPVGRVALLRAAGAGTRQAGAAVAAEQFLVLGSCLLLTAVFAAWAQGEAAAVGRLALGVCVLAGLAGLLVVRWWVRSRSVRLRARPLALAALLTLLGHGVFVAGYALCLPSSAATMVDGAGFAAATFAGTVMGMLAPFAPGGIGVREATMVALAGEGAQGQVIVAAALARLLILLVEAAVGGWAWWRGRRRAGSGA